MEKEQIHPVDDEGKKVRNPAVRYPSLISGKKKKREQPESEHERKTEEVRNVRQTVWNFLRILLYAAFGIWAFVNCRQAWAVLPGMEIRIHLFFFLLYLLLPAAIIDVLLRLFRRPVFGKEGSARMTRDNWTLTGLVILLAFVMITWYLLWTYVVRDIAIKPQ